MMLVHDRALVVGVLDLFLLLCHTAAQKWFMEVMTKIPIFPFTRIRAQESANHTLYIST